ncbi:MULTISPECIES: hypothetical protein [Bradyrhizobium]|uniref:hypothetical protein n=1 Tax=Bradyrhizobium elkanii TaxID=29448 RepID=UPI0003F81346|nr:hypothetical protein [Bradyrhizobium elkanii]
MTRKTNLLRKIILVLPHEHARANAINGAAAANRWHRIEDHFRNGTGRTTVVGRTGDPTIQPMVDPMRLPTGRSFAHR